MSALSDHLKETNRLLHALNEKKQKKRSVSARSNQKFSRIDKKKKRARVRALPVVLTRTAVITMMLMSIAIVLGGIEYFKKSEANAVIDSKSPFLQENSVQHEQIDDNQLLNILSKQE